MGHYLVTGAAGFIGARVTETLLDEGYLVSGYVCILGERRESAAPFGLVAAHSPGRRSG